MQNIKKIAVTGGAGQICYSLLFRIANGDLLGKDQPVALHILEVPQGIEALKGVVMELNDCCFPLLREIVIGSDANEVFEAIDYAILVGAKPRGPGMERKDLLLENAKIFVAQGKALNKVASKNVKVLVVGNPCNTNCLITMHNAPDIPRENFFAMTRLDENRAKGFLAAKANVLSTDIKKMIIWGNHSATQVPDFINATIKEQPVLKAVEDKNWLENEFIPLVQKRGAEIIAARGKSSAASAANAAIDSICSINSDSSDIFSLAVYSDKNPYGIADGLIFSFPCSSKEGRISIEKRFTIDEFLDTKIKQTEKELLEEKDAVAKLL